MSKVKINLANGTVLEKPLVTCFKGTNGNYIVFDNESNGSMGLPIIIISKFNGNSVEKILDPNEWGAVKESLKTIISGTALPYLNVPESVTAQDDFFTQLTLPVASFDLLRSVYKPEVIENPAEEAPVENDTTDASGGEVPNLVVEEPAVQVVPDATPLVPEAPIVQMPAAPEVPVMEAPVAPAPIEPAPVMDTPVATEPAVIEPVAPENVPNMDIPIVEANQMAAPEAPVSVDAPVIETPVIETPASVEIPQAPEAPAVELPTVEMPEAPAVESPVVDIASPEIPAAPQTVETPVIAPTPQEAPASVDAPAVVETSLDMTNVVTEDTHIALIKETFMKSCENMFDALIKKFENK